MIGSNFAITFMVIYPIVFAIVKSLGINELEIEERYLEITPNNIYSMVFTKDIKENKTKVVLKENK